MCVGWCGFVCVCAFLCVGWHVPPEVRVDCCALCVRVCVHVCAHQRVLFDRRHVFGRPWRARPNDTASLVVRQFPLPPSPNLRICSSAERSASGLSRLQIMQMHEVITHESRRTFTRFFQDSAAKVSKSRPSPCLMRQCDAGRRLSRATQNGSPDFELRLPRTGRQSCSR